MNVGVKLSKCDTADLVVVIFPLRFFFFNYVNLHMSQRDSEIPKKFQKLQNETLSGWLLVNSGKWMGLTHSIKKFKKILIFT